MNSFISEITPPFLIKVGRRIKNALTGNSNKNSKYYRLEDNNKQELDIYWTDEMAAQLESWGKDHTWIEIECLLVNCKGRVLDIACGTGVNILAMNRFPNLEIYGFDISDFLIKKGIEKGIDPNRLKVYDGTKTGYSDNEFDYSYSIGSLEHFTEEGIDQFLRECSRYTKTASFHMIPISESGSDEGWIRTNQSYNNNSVEWWMKRFTKHFRQVHVINSGYKDEGVSLGRWFVCVK